MSGTVMKFGPQWIRTLTDGAAPSSATNQNTTITTNNIGSGGNGNGGSSSTTTITSSSSSSSFSTNNALSNTNNNNNSNSNNSNSTTSSSSTLSSSAVSNYYNNNPALYSNNNSSSNNNGSINNNNTNPGKYKLAEFRYGREEMLALFEPNMEAPDDIKQFTDLFVEKARMPMAMTQMSEEEVKLSTRSWNSEAVLRSASGKIAAAAAAGGGSAAGGIGGGGVGVGSGGSVGVGGAGSNHVSAGISGVGGSLSGHGVINSTMVDRDTRQLSERGALTAAEVLSSSPRGPPGSLSRVPLGEQRGLLSSLSSRGHPATIRNLVGRGTNMYMRSQSHDDEGIVSGDGSSSGAASAGIGASGPGSGYDSRFGVSNQPRQPNSLRARFENSRTAAGVAGLPNSTKPVDIKTGAEGEIPGGGRSVFDRLPSKYNADDKLIRKDINGRPIQTDWRSREWSASGQDGASRPPKGIGPPTEDRSWRSTRVGGAGTAEDWRSGGNQTSNTAAAPSSSWYVRTDDQRNQRQQLPQNQENLNPSFSGKRDTLRRPSNDDKQGDDDDDSINIQPRHRRDSLPEWSIGDPLSGDKVGSFDASGAFREISRDDGNSSLNNSRTKASERQQQQLNQLKRQQDQQHKEPHQQGNDFEHLERAAEIMVEKWTSEEEQHERKSSSSPDFLGNKSNMTTREQHDAHHANILPNNSIENRKSSQVQPRKEQHQSGSDQQAAASNTGAPANSFETNNQQKLILLPPNHGESQQWFYRDTQGVIQGPFSANDMYEWWKAGYFVKELLVRRACDELFYPLGEVIKMWDRIPFAPIPMNLAPPPPITNQTIHQFRTVAKQLELAASQGRIPPNAYDVAHPGAVLLHGPLLQHQQQQQIHPVLAAASLNQNALAPPDQQANIRQIIEAATRQQQQQQQQHEPAVIQQQRNIPVSVPDQNEMQAQLRQLLVQLKNREGFANLNAQEQQEALVRQFVATRAMPQNNVGNGNALQDQQDHQALLQQQRVRMVPFMPPFLSNDQQERIRYQQELERRQKEEAEKQQQQQNRLIMEQRMKVEEEKQRLMEEVQKQRLKKQNEENEKQKQEAEKERILKMSQLKQQQLAKQHEEFKQQMQNQQRLQQQEKQQQHQQQQQQPQQPLQPQTNSLSTVQQQQQQQIERAKKAAQAHQVQQEQQQQQRKTAWSTVSKPDQEPVSLATLQKLQEEEKERERQRQQQQAQANQHQQQQQQQQQQQIHNFQRQMTWANAAQSKAAPIKTLAEIQKEEEERLARERQRKPKVQPTVASAGVWNNAASHLSWKNPPSDS